MKKILSAIALAAFAFSANAGLVLTGFEFNAGVPVTDTHLGAGSLNSTRVSNNIGTGALRATWSTAPGTADDVNYIVYCIELTAGISNWNVDNNTYSLYTNPAYNSDAGLQPFSAGQTRLLENLFALNNGASNLTANDSAAMQMAIWNIVYDTDLTVGAGNFRSSDGGTAGNDARARADQLLAAADAYTIDEFTTVDLISFNSGAFVQGSCPWYNHHCNPKMEWDPKYQDFLTANVSTNFGGGCLPGQDCGTIPEPGSMALAASAMLGLGIVGRRRKLKVVSE